MNDPLTQLKRPGGSVGGAQLELMFHSRSVDRETFPATMLAKTDTSCCPAAAGSNSMPPPVPAARLFAIVLLEMLTYVFVFSANRTSRPPPTPLVVLPLIVELWMIWVFQPPPR